MLLLECLPCIFSNSKSSSFSSCCIFNLMVRLFPLIVSFWIGEARSYKISVVGNNWLVGWLVDWLVGNAVFSETAIRIFLTFWMKLADYKGRKFKKPEFWKKFFDWRYSRKGLQISQLTIFFIFGLKLVLNMTFNVNETYFSEKNLIWGYLTSNSSKNCLNWGFWPCSRLPLLVFFDFYIMIGGHDV